MPHEPSDPEVRLHATRAQAMACNNRAWDLVEQTTRTANETQAMCDAAQEAQRLWDTAKQETLCVERLRAQQLVACAMARAGRTNDARNAAQAASETEAALDPSELTTFDRVMTQVAHALASARASDLREIHPALQSAMKALDDEEQALVLRLLGGD